MSQHSIRLNNIRADSSLTINNGIVSITNATNSTSLTTGSLVLSGGLGIAKDMFGVNSNFSGEITS